MAVSDLYLVQFLIQSTQECELQWLAGEASEFRAELNEVRLCLFSVHATDGARLCLRISRDAKRTFIEEPRNTSIFGTRYRSDEDRSLAEALRFLAEIVSRQCALRRAEDWDLRESIRENLYRQLLFGN
jgi:hypothetical protein